MGEHNVWVYIINLLTLKVWKILAKILVLVPLNFITTLQFPNAVA